MGHKIETIKANKIKYIKLVNKFKILRTLVCLEDVRAHHLSFLNCYLTNIVFHLSNVTIMLEIIIFIIIPLLLICKRFINFF